VFVSRRRLWCVAIGKGLRRIESQARPKYKSNERGGERTFFFVENLWMDSRG